MPRLVTKFSYIRPGQGKSPGGYAKYIATREGVEKIDDSHINDPVSKAQQKLIARILKDFPEMEKAPAYAAYLRNSTKGNASAFISRALDEHAEEIADSKTYADYIATRPGAERIGTHGLFTDEGVTVHLGKVSEELNHYPGHVYTLILSLKREDAERLGYESGTRWRDLLRSQTETIATNFKIPLNHLKWYGAFHNAGHHPHVHLMIYSTVPGEGHLSEYAIEKIRSTFAREIFAQEMLCVYQKQTEYRDNLRYSSQERIAQIVAEINEGAGDNPAIQALLVELAQRLAKTSGKKVYGYLKPDVKQIVDRIVAELSKDERIQELYALWYDRREEVLRTYTDTFPDRIPLEQNPEFKTIRNAVIKEAMKIAKQFPAPIVRTQPAPPQEDSAPQDADWWRDYPFPGGGDSSGEEPPETLQQEPQPEPHTPSKPQWVNPFPPMPTPRTGAPIGASVRLLRSLARMIQAKSEQEQSQKPRLDRKQLREIQEKKQALGMRD